MEPRRLYQRRNSEIKSGQPRLTDAHTSGGVCFSTRGFGPVVTQAGLCVSGFVITGRGQLRFSDPFTQFD